VKKLRSRKAAVKITCLIVTLVGFGGIVYSSYTVYTAQAVKIEKVRESTIVVVDDSGISNTVAIPEGIHELVREGEDYFISYKTRKWRLPQLESLKPLDNQITEVNEKNESAEVDNADRFSYLEELPLEKQEALSKFVEERDIQHLYDFSPVDMAIVYLYCLSLSDPYLLYAITYDAGLLPDQDTFREEYFEYAANHDSDIAVHYRHYDSIEAHEDPVEANKVTVLVKAGVGIITHSLALGLQKEDRLWKLDIYHVIKSYKENIENLKFGRR